MVSRFVVGESAVVLLPEQDPVAVCMAGWVAPMAWVDSAP